MHDRRVILRRNHNPANALWASWVGQETQLWPAASYDSVRVREIRLVVRVLIAVFVAAIGLVGAATGGGEAGVKVLLVLLLAGVIVLVLSGRAPALPYLLLSMALVLLTVSPDLGVRPANILSIASLLLVAARTTRFVLAALPLMGAAFVIVGALAGYPVDIALDDAVVTLTPSLAASVFLTAVVGNAMREDQIHQERLRTEVATSYESARRTAADSTRQLLHDRVLGVLSLLQLEKPQQPVRIREICRRTAAALHASAWESPPKTDVRGQSTVADVVAEARDAVGLIVRCNATGETMRQELEPHVAAAVTRALAEALRNVQRHAMTDRADIDIQSSGDTWRLVVHDDGVGGNDVGTGWGSTHSIQMPLMTIGGSAQIHSSPGRGTSVTLLWPAESANKQPDSMSLSFTIVRRSFGDAPILSTVVVPLLLANGYIAIRYAWGSETAFPQIGLALATAVVTYSLCSRLLDRGPSPTLVITMSSLSCVTVTAGLALTGRGEALLTYDSWYVGLAAVGTFAFAVFLPARWAVVLAVPTLVVLLAATWWSGDVALPDVWEAVMVASLPTYSYLAGATLRRVERRLADEVALLANAGRALDRAIRSDPAIVSQRRFLETQVRPWLEEVGAGSIPLAAATTPRAARRLASQARDELNCPGMFDAHLRERVASARDLGVEINFVPGDSSDPDTDRLLIRLFDRVLDEREQLEGLIVYFAIKGEGSITTTPPLPQQMVDRLIAYTPETFSSGNDSLTTTLTVRVPTSIAR